MLQHDAAEGRTTPAGTPIETIAVETPSVACDGGDGPLGHPRVYLTVLPPGAVDCPYCGRHFVFAGDPSASHGH
ncbi:MAG: zinc-finger domain-containing protein [Alphaproteobacteria bacterium]